MRPSANTQRARLCFVLTLSLALFNSVPLVMGQVQPESQGRPRSEAAPVANELSPVAARVDVEPVARDEQIRERLQRILVATGWFTDPNIRVEEGVVFLRGGVGSAELKKWAGDLARNTQGVAAVANQMDVNDSSAWDFSSARLGLSELWRDVLRASPLLMLGVVILVLTVLVAWATTHGIRSLLARRISSRLLRGLFARGAGVLVILLGL